MTASLSRRRAPDALPLTLLTGFLGAGKTTLLNRLLRSPDLAGAVVVINEFGAIPIDHLLVESADAAVLTLSSGCLCCTVRGDLVATLEDLLRRRDNGRMALFDRVVIETTGLAEPAPILNAVAGHPYLKLRFRAEAVITLVDAVHAMTTLDRFDEAVLQVAVADRLMISKTDLAAPSDVSALRRRLAALNPLADIVDGDGPAMSAEELLGGSLLRGAERLASQPGYDGGQAPGHRLAHELHGPGMTSAALSAEAPLPRAAIETFLGHLLAQHGPTLLRVKGLLALDDDPTRPLLVQIVQHTPHPHRRLADWPDGDRRSRLVVIGRGLDQAAVRRLWNRTVEDRIAGVASATPAAAEFNPS